MPPQKMFSFLNLLFYYFPTIIVHEILWKAKLSNKSISSYMEELFQNISRRVGNKIKKYKFHVKSIKTQRENSFPTLFRGFFFC